MEEVRLKKGIYSLHRESDNRGDSGPAWRVYDFKRTIENNDYVWVDDSSGLIKVGYGIRIGALTARSYSEQDWWQCSEVKEILKVVYNPDNEPVEVTFKTRNSNYIARSL